MQIWKKLHGITCQNEEMSIPPFPPFVGGNTDCSLFVLVCRILNFERDHFRCVRKIANRDYQLRHVCLSVWNKSVSTRHTIMKFGN
jgi:hypothetical protein